MKINKKLTSKKIPGDKAAKNDKIDRLHKAISSKLKTLFRLQRITQELFKKSEEHYRSFFENSLDGMYKSTLDGKYIDANLALVKMLGYKSKEKLLSVNIPNQIYASKKRSPGRR